MATILVCGDRRWKCESTICTSLKEIWNEGEQTQFERTAKQGGYKRLIHGDCYGADKMAGRLGKEIGFEVEAYPADWDTYGRAAGPIRNRQMITEEQVDLIVAFHDDIAHSKGTRDMISAGLKKKIPVILISSDGTTEIIDKLD